MQAAQRRVTYPPRIANFVTHVAGGGATNEQLPIGALLPPRRRTIIDDDVLVLHGFEAVSRNRAAARRPRRNRQLANPPATLERQRERPGKVPAAQLWRTTDHHQPLSKRGFIVDSKGDALSEHAAGHVARGLRLLERKVSRKCCHDTTVSVSRQSMAAAAPPNPRGGFDVRAKSTSVTQGAIIYHATAPQKWHPLLPLRLPRCSCSPKHDSVTCAALPRCLFCRLTKPVQACP